MTVKSVRLLRAGDIIAKGTGEREVVREVLVIARLANGETLDLPSDQVIETFEPEDVSHVEQELASDYDASV